MKGAAFFAKDAILAVLFLPVFFSIGLLIAIIFGLVGGFPSAFVSAWPFLEYYIDRFLTPLLPPSWIACAMRRADIYIDFYSDPARRKRK